MKTSAGNSEFWDLFQLKQSQPLSMAMNGTSLWRNESVRLLGPALKHSVKGPRTDCMAWAAVGRIGAEEAIARGLTEVIQLNFG